MKSLIKNIKKANSHNNIMDSYNFQISKENPCVKLPRLHKIKRPRTNYFRDKERSESIPLKVSMKEELKIHRGRSKDFVKNIAGKNSEIEYLVISEDGNGKAGGRPPTKCVNNWSKRIFFARRIEMARKNLIILVFDGVVGDCFKRNLWEEGPVKLYFRRGVIKELKELLEEFQVVLFFISNDIKPRKILKYLTSKDIIFDAVYKSRNSSQYAKSHKFSKNPTKKPLKYTEFIQNFSQIYLDFGLQNEIQEKVLLVTSVSLSPEDLESKGESLLVHRNSHNLLSYLW